MAVVNVLSEQSIAGNPFLNVCTEISGVAPSVILVSPSDITCVAFSSTLVCLCIMFLLLLILRLIDRQRKSPTWGLLFDLFLVLLSSLLVDTLQSPLVQYPLFAIGTQEYLKGFLLYILGEGSELLQLEHLRN